MALLFVAAQPAVATGIVQGQVIFDGPVPARVLLKRTTDKVCAATEAFEESVVVSKDGKGLGNVVVRVQGAPATPTPAEPVVVDQKTCLFTPRVQGAVEGQKLEVRNGDPTFHNVHGYQGPKTIFNTGQPPNVRPMRKVLRAGDVVRLGCDVHPWMVAYVLVGPNPYFAITDSEGRFRIDGIPPGAYTVEAWHEKLGTRSAQVTVEDAKSSELGFVFSPPPPEETGQKSEGRNQSASSTP